MKRLISFLIAFVLVFLMIPANGFVSLAAEEAFNTENFKGLVLTTDVSGLSVSLYEGVTESATKMTPVYTEGTTYYYEVEAGGRYYYVARPASGNARYNIRKNIYITPEEANTKQVLDVTPHVRSTAGWDTYESVKGYSDEAMAAAFPSSVELWPEYAHLLTTPVLTNPRNPHQQTTQTEMMDYIGGLNSADDDMYVYILGKSGGRKASEYFDIPVVFFTKTDLSGAKTWEDAASLLRENGKLTFLYQAQIHGKETGAGEAAFAMLKHLDGDYGAGLLDNMNICVIPRLNTWGAYRSDRSVYTTEEIDANRDYMALTSAEVQLTVKLYNHLEPELFYDAHECFVHPEYEQLGMHDVWSSVNFVPFTTQEFKNTALTLADKIFERAEENNLTYGWYSSSVNGYNTTVGTTNLHVRGSLVFLTESQGILGGNQQIERRIMAHVSTVTGVLDYVNENTAAVQKVVDDQRADIINRGRTYESSDVIVLETGYTVHPEQNINGKQVDTCSGEITDTVFTGKTYDVVKKSRIAPTAYVIPAGESWTEDVLALLEKQGIQYTFLPEGATLPLQQYGGTTTEATLTEESAVTFSKGAYVMTMAQGDAYILALLMEPDVKDLASYSGTLAQQGRIPAVGGTFPIYRYIRDLNEEDFVDYTIVEFPPVEATVYVDNTNGVDTNDGLTAATPVKTLEKAYEIMEAAVAQGSKGSKGTVVISGLYELGAATYHFPAANYPVTITGMTTGDGLSFTGGTGDAHVNRAIHLHGETTFQNIKLHVNNSQSYNYIFANGHKLVLGTGLNTTVTKTNYYFTVSGGSALYGEKVDSVDVTIRSGNWRMIYLGGYYGDVTGTAKLDLSDASVYYSIVGSYRGNVGSLEIKLANAAISKTTDKTHGIFAGTYTANSNYDCGKLLGDAKILLGEGVTAQAVYGSARTYGHVSGKVTVIADGVDLTKVPVKARYSGLSASYRNGETTLQLNRDVAADLAVDASVALDLCGHDITGNVTVDGTLTVKDSATDDYDVSDGVYGEITGTVTGTLAAADGYVAAAKGFHKFDQYISGVSLRPSNAGIYYTATVLADEVLRSEFASQGVAVSLADLPGADFETDEDTLYATGSNGVLVQNILKGDGEDPDRGITDIYAASYVKLQDGTVLVSDENVAYSLYDVLLLIRAQNPDALNSFLTKWNIESWFR